MSSETSDSVSEILQARCGLPTAATLSDGKRLTIHNIAWGRDLGEPYDHVTTNISPAPDSPHTVDFFTTDQVVRLVALESGSVLYQAADEA